VSLRRIKIPPPAVIAPDHVEAIAGCPWKGDTGYTVSPMVLGPLFK